MLKGIIGVNFSGTRFGSVSMANDSRHAIVYEKATPGSHSGDVPRTLLLQHPSDKKVLFWDIQFADLREFPKAENVAQAVAQLNNP